MLHNVTIIRRLHVYNVTDAVGGSRPRGQESGRAGGVPNHEPLLGADALCHHQKHHHQGDPGPGV